MEGWGLDPRRGKQGTPENAGQKSWGPVSTP